MKDEMVQRSAKHALEYQLNVMCKDPFEVYIDNEKTTLDEALERCVRENSVYMPDYVLDEKGNLKQVRFDKIRM